MNPRTLQQAPDITPNAMNILDQKVTIQGLVITRDGTQTPTVTFGRTRAEDRAIAVDRSGKFMIQARSGSIVRFRIATSKYFGRVVEIDASRSIRSTVIELNVDVTESPGSSLTSKYSAKWTKITRTDAVMRMYDDLQPPALLPAEPVHDPCMVEMASRSLAWINS